MSSGTQAVTIRPDDSVCVYIYIFMPQERLVIHEACVFIYPSVGDSFFWLVVNRTAKIFTLDFFKSPGV